MNALATLLLAGGASAWCGICDNAPSRSWSWWFGFSACDCDDGWSGRCCGEWSVSDWDVKVADWARGDSCEAQPSQACARVSNSPAEKSFTQEWQHEPAALGRSECESEGCMWVECFPSDNNNLGTASASEMCSNCDGPWKDECEWHHYKPGWLAFAGPGEHCGFRYPSCPASAAKNCFCGDEAVQELRAGWCSGGVGMDTFCPTSMVHGDGRSQPCSWTGWTVSPQDGGDHEAICSGWGF